MEDPQTDIWVPIGYCNVGNLCAYIIPLEFAVCSFRQQAQDNLAQQFFWDRGPRHSSQLVQLSAREALEQVGFRVDLEGPSASPKHGQGHPACSPCVQEAVKEACCCCNSLVGWLPYEGVFT